MLSDHLYLSFHSDDNPDEYKVLVFDLDMKQILTEIVIQNTKEYLDQIISFGNGEIVFSDYDLKNFYLNRYDLLNRQVINQVVYHFGTKILNIEKETIVIFDNYNLSSIDISSFSEKWKFNLNNDNNENIVVTDFKKCDCLDVKDSAICNSFIVSNFKGINKHPINNKLIIIDKNGHLSNSFLLPEKFQIVPNLPSTFFISNEIKLISGYFELKISK